MFQRVLLISALVLLGCGTSERAPREEPAETDIEPVQLVAGIAWRAEAPLLGRRPSSEIRVAEYGVRGHADAELVVFHFVGEAGAEGGTVSENVDRWLDQFSQADGRTTREVAEIDAREIDGRNVTVVRARGRFSGMRGSGAADGVDDYALYGAIVEAPEGLVFFKLLGPRAGVDAAEGAFEDLLDSIRVVHS
jgi:hypothetical protein